MKKIVSIIFALNVLQQRILKNQKYHKINLEIAHLTKIMNHRIKNHPYFNINKLKCIPEYHTNNF